MNEITSLQPPVSFSTEAEQQLLGAILLDADRLGAVADFLKAEHFGDPFHARLYAICQDRHAKRHMVSAVAIASLLQDDPQLQQLGGGRYLIRLAGASIASDQIVSYAQLIVEMACRRGLTEAVNRAHQALFGGGESLEVKTGLQQALLSLPEARGAETTVGLFKAAIEAVDQVNLAYQGQQTFLKTGVGALDKILRGLGPGDYMLLGGATSMGKTSMALEIASNVAEAGKGVCFVSLEMTRQELATRLISARSRVPYADVRAASEMPEANMQKWMEAAVQLKDLPFRIVPKHVRDLAAVQAAATKASHEMPVPLSLLVVDYAQLIRGHGKDRFEQMTNVSIGLKTMAGLLGVPIIALVQLSRDIGKREDKRPQLSDIKETGQFENDADQVVFCHREDYWMRREGAKPDRTGQVTVSAQADFEAELKRVSAKMQLIVRKNRHGPLATAEVGFHDATNRFWSLSEHEQVGFDYD